VPNFAWLAGSTARRGAIMFGAYGAMGCRNGRSLPGATGATATTADRERINSTTARGGGQWGAGAAGRNLPEAAIVTWRHGAPLDGSGNRRWRRGTG
jgi:hypothetical protein